MWRVRPTEYLEHWSDRDRKLAEAHVLKETLLCPCGCGQPRKLAHDDRYADDWMVGETICFARQTLDRANDDPDGDEPGTMRFVYFNPDYKPPAS